MDQDAPSPERAEPHRPDEQGRPDVRYRYQVVLPDGQVLSGEVVEREVPDGIIGKCKVPERHATMATILEQVDRLTRGPRVHHVQLIPLAPADAEDTAG